MKSKFLTDVAWFTFAQAIAGGLMLLYVVTAARLLGDIETYGLFQSFMSIYGVVFVLGFPLNVVTIQRVSKSDLSQSPAILNSCLKMGGGLGIAAGSILAFFAPVLATGLNSPSILPFFAVAALLAVAFTLTVFYGYLQGRNKYKVFAVVKIVEATFSCLAGCILMFLGYGVIGAILGYVIGMTIVLLYLVTSIDFKYAQSSFKWTEEFVKMRMPIAVSAVLLICVAGPMIISRWRMDEWNSGIFAALFTFRNVLQPFALAVALPLYSWTLGKRPEKKNVQKAFAVVTTIGISFLILTLLAPQLCVRLLLGTNFAEASSYLPAYAFALLLYMLSMVTMFYNAAKQSLHPIALASPLIAMIGLTMYPDLTISVVISFQIIGWSIFLGLMVLSCLIVQYTTAETRDESEYRASG
jgi:O-antigen/teichoic acid export membrane protein